MSRESQERLAALGFLAFGVVGVWVSKRPTTDIALGLIGALGVLYFLAPAVVRAFGDAASRRRADRRWRQNHETPWTMYSEPHPTESMWEVGVRRRTEDGVDLDRRPLRKLDPEADLDIAVAEEECRVKAVRWTENKVNM